SASWPWRTPDSRSAWRAGSRPRRKPSSRPLRPTRKESAEVEILQIDSQSPDSKALIAAAETVLRGGVIAFPTDTLYGLGCSLFDVAAVELIARLKRRDPSLAVISLIPDPAQVYGLASEVSQVAERLMARYWPGPVSLIFKAAPLIPPPVRGAGGTV